MGARGPPTWMLEVPVQEWLQGVLGKACPMGGTGQVETASVVLGWRGCARRWPMWWLCPSLADMVLASTPIGGGRRRLGASTEAQAWVGGCLS